MVSFYYKSRHSGPRFAYVLRDTAAAAANPKSACPTRFDPPRHEEALCPRRCFRHGNCQDYSSPRLACQCLIISSHLRCSRSRPPRHRRTLQFCSREAAEVGFSAKKRALAPPAGAPPPSPSLLSVDRRPQAAHTRLRMCSSCFSLIRPTATASITMRASPQRSAIFFCPRMKCCSKPNETSSRLLTRSAAVRCL